MLDSQRLAYQYGKRFVAVHHLEAHTMIARMPIPLPSLPLPLPGLPRVQFPFLCVIASGGHTLLVVCRGVADYSLLAGTVDDSLGEAFDKLSVMLRLREYAPQGDSQGSGSGPGAGLVAGGVLVERMADRYNKRIFPGDSDPGSCAGMDARQLTTRVRKHLRQPSPGDPCPLPPARYDLRTPLMDKPGNPHYSFSGVKNAFRRLALLEQQQLGPGPREPPVSQPLTVPLLPVQSAERLCALFQEVVLDHVRDKLSHALGSPAVRQERLQGLVVVGGVASNRMLRRYYAPGYI